MPVLAGIALDTRREKISIDSVRSALKDEMGIKKCVKRRRYELKFSH
jgi:hypothetical protein